MPSKRRRRLWRGSSAISMMVRAMMTTTLRVANRAAIWSSPRYFSAFTSRAIASVMPSCTLSSPISLATCSSTPSNSSWWRRSWVMASSTWPDRRATSTWLKPRRARSATNCRTRSSSSAPTAQRPTPTSCSPTRSALAGWANQAATRAATSNSRSLASTCSVARKWVARKWARFSPMRSLFSGMMAVCGIGSPQGCRNSATTANQSATAPTMAASAKAAT